jgi:phospholipase C
MAVKERRFLAIVFFCSVFALGILLACGGSSKTATTQPPPPPPAQFSKIKHVVVIVQENRTPDNLFHGLPNADIANSGVNSKGETIPLTPIPLAAGYDLSHNHAAFLDMYDNGKMDGADKVPSGCSPASGKCPHPQFVYVDPADVVPYFQMAEEFSFGDRMFQTQQGPSFPAHQFLISGTSAPTADSNLFAAENPTLPPGVTIFYGCTSAPGTAVRLIDPNGDESQTTFPCFEHPTLTDELNAANIDWRYYSQGASGIWNGPNAIRHIRNGPDWTNHVTLVSTQVLKDIAAQNLPPVTWVTPGGAYSDHPAGNKGSGPSWVASIVNAIGNSSYWADTAIIITWDDWGGFYDHVAPPIFNSYEYGFRVPLIIVSPYAKQGYVSHATHDFGSILKMIEEVYNLPSLNYADARADDFADCFDFNQTPVVFKPFAAKLDANYFINDKSPSIPADTD